jgi:hypothetical protein
LRAATDVSVVDVDGVGLLVYSEAATTSNATWEVFLGGADVCFVVGGNALAFSAMAAAA